VPVRNDSVYKIRRYCNPSPPDPILIIDGVIQKSNNLSQLIPDEVVSIEILKYPNTPIATHYTKKPVISIITRAGNRKTFLVKDKQSGEILPKATLRFWLEGDTTTMLGDKSGVLTINGNKIKAGAKVKVSHTGYLPVEANIEDLPERILLEKDFKTCAAVIVVAYEPTRCGRCVSGCGYSTFRCEWITRDSKLTSAKNIMTSLYPNPVQKGNFFHLQFTGKQDEALTMNLYSLNGSLILSRPIKIMKGNNTQSVRADQRLAAGIYIVHLKNAAGTVLMNEKLMIQ
jgi:hypothetical protein